MEADVNRSYYQVVKVKGKELYLSNPGSAVGDDSFQSSLRKKESREDMTRLLKHYIKIVQNP